jgi:hypothetical protein
MRTATWLKRRAPEGVFIARVPPLGWVAKGVTNMAKAPKVNMKEQVAWLT